MKHTLCCQIPKSNSTINLVMMHLFGVGKRCRRGNPYAGWGGQTGPFSYSYSSGGLAFRRGDFVDPFEIFEQFLAADFQEDEAHKKRNIQNFNFFMDSVSGVTKSSSSEEKPVAGP